MGSTVIPMIYLEIQYINQSESGTYAVDHLGFRENWCDIEADGS
jgi:hypothetical protein